MNESEDNGHREFLIQTSGYSMWPFLKPREKILVKAIAGEDLACGDVILYKDRGRLVCHRLIRKLQTARGLSFLVRGDNAVYASEKTLDDELLGKVVGIVRGGRIINLECRRRRFINRIIIAVAPLISVIIRALKRLHKKSVYI